MQQNDSEYGRRRVKKSRPAITPAAEQAAKASPPETNQGKSEPDIETQASLNIPMPDTIQPSAEPVTVPEAPPPIPAPVLDDEPQVEKTADEPRIEQPRLEKTPQEATQRDKQPAEKPPVEKAAIDQPRPDRPRQPRPERRGERSDRSDRGDRGDGREIREPRRESRERPRERPSERFPERIPERAQERPPHRQVPDRRRVRISVIIPAFNEEDNIKPLLDQFHEVISRVGNDWEIILVDDGSTDKTSEKAREAAIRFHWLRVIGYKGNRGLTAALETGFQNARGSIFVFYPADLQYHPQDIPRMINRIERGADLVTGWKQGRYQKRFVSFIYNKLCQALFSVKVHDLNSVKAFKKEVIDKVRMRRDWHRYMVVLAAEAGFNIDEVKVNVYPRHAGQSKFGTGRILGGVLDLLAVKFQVSFTRKPLRFFGTLGVLSILAGFITGLLAIYLRYFTIHGSRVWLYLVILFVLSGLMLFSLGFLAEVIVSLRDEIESLKGKK
jgi:glycosyltransferase involved in cell wall biosynthesis